MCINAGKKCVLGLATGSTPIHVYRELVRMHKEGSLPFKNVVTFNLDEYYGLNPDDLQSYHKFMVDELSHSKDLSLGLCDTKFDHRKKSRLTSSC